MTYDYKCNQCSHTFEKTLRMAQREEPLSEPCPNCNIKDSVLQYLPSGPAIGDPVRLGIRRVPEAFQHDVLGRIKASVPGADKTIGRGKFNHNRLV